MDLTNHFWQWLLSPVASMLLITGVIYLFRDGILRILSARLNLNAQKELQSNQQKFEQEIDRVRREFDRIQATQEKMLTSLLEISSERAKSVSKREIEASEAIWASVNKLNGLLVTAQAADFLDFDAIEALEGSDRAKVNQIVKLFTKLLTPEFMKSINCQWTRLYVNETAWAFYHAYSMILLSGAIRMMAVECGFANSKFFDNKVLRDAILEALPHQRPTFQKFPNVGSSLFLDELRQALIIELRKSIQGEISTEKEAERARAILDALPNEVSIPGL